MRLKRALAGILIAVGLCVLTGCHSGNVSTGSLPVAAIQATPISLAGQWHQIENGIPDTNMSAVISGNQITILLGMADDGNGNDQVSGLYWQGTFNPTEAGDQVSKADQTALDDSVYGSEDPTKKFTYNTDGDLGFQFSILGLSTTVELSRGSS